MHTAEERVGENVRDSRESPTVFSFSVSPDDLSLRMGEYELNGTNEPHKHIDRKVQIVASHPKFDPKT